MPSWFNNCLKVVEGDPQEVWDGIGGERPQKVWWTIFGKNPSPTGRVPFDFNRLIPAPEGAVWPTWHNDNWGAKYADYFTLVDKATLTFDTPWDPPVQIYEAIARKFPNHKIEITGSDCEYLGRHLHVVIANGELSGEITDCDCPGVGSFRDQAWRQMGRPSVYDEEALIRLAEQIRQSKSDWEVKSNKGAGE
jgi:hypothetical protein